MNMRDLISWTRGSGQTPDLFREDRTSGFAALQREMNRLLEDAFRGFDAPALFGRGQNLTAMNWPKIEVNETDAQIQVSAELPGLDEKDIDVLISDGALIIRGEKKAEVEDKNRQFSERFYGRFERQIPLGVRDRGRQDRSLVQERRSHGNAAKERPRPDEDETYRDQRADETLIGRR